MTLFANSLPKIGGVFDGKMCDVGHHQALALLYIYLASLVFVHIANRMRLAMRLRAMRQFVLLVAIALAPPAFAQTSNDAALKALYSRVIELNQAGK
jgi:hypothetical protein